MSACDMGRLAWTEACGLFLLLGGLGEAGYPKSWPPVVSRRAEWWVRALED